jgi:hypothetical protein
LREIGEFYGAYGMYHQSASNVPAVLDPVSSWPSGRCEVLVRHLLEFGVFPGSGTLHDIGAGSDAMLRAFSATCSDSKLFGLTLDDRTPFALVSVSHTAARAGKTVEAARVDGIHKEISLLAGVYPQPSKSDHDDPRRTIDKIEGNVSWLNSMFDHTRETAGSGEFGIFGTSVAARWLASGLGDAVKSFVDEDPARKARLHLGRPILRPEQVPPRAVMYLALVREVSAAFSRRVADLPVSFTALPVQAA